MELIQDYRSMDLKMLTLVALLIINCGLFAQPAVQDIHLTKYYKNASVLFTERHESQFPDLNSRKRFTPSIDEIILFEDSIWSQHKLYSLNRSTLKNCRRQYYGEIDDSKKYLIVTLLLIRSKKMERTHFDGWKRDHFLGVGSFYNKRIRVFRFNVDNFQLSRF
jgi:hypothetical protein